MMGVEIHVRHWVICEDCQWRGDPTHNPHVAGSHAQEFGHHVRRIREERLSAVPMDGTKEVDHGG